MLNSLIGKRDKVENKIGSLPALMNSMLVEVLWVEDNFWIDWQSVWVWSRYIDSPNGVLLYEALQV